jgi:hypothetical protein
MTASGVVGALHNIHQSLRSQAILLDIHPEPQPAAVEIWSRTKRVSLPPIIDPSNLIANIQRARGLLDTVVHDGYFALEAAASVDFVSHFKSVEAWFAFRIQRGKSVNVNEDVVAEARRMLEREHGVLRIRERISLRRLRRI